MEFIALQDIDADSIALLKKKFSIRPEQTVYHLEDKAKIIGNIKELVILGHTGKGAATLGDYNVDAFAKCVAKKINTSDRHMVEQIYMVGCEVGMSQLNKPALAQRLANQLHKLGFTHLQVHAITNPIDSACYGMRVEMLQRPGVSEIVGYKSGNVKVYVHTTARQEKLCSDLSELEQNLRRPGNREAAKAILTNEEYKNRLILVDTANLKAELDRPHNTFIPGRNEPLAKKYLKQEQFIHAVEGRVRLLTMLKSKNKDEEKLCAKLQVLLHQLKQATFTEWHSVITAALKPYRGNGLTKFYQRNVSTFYNLITDFCRQFNIPIKDLPKVKQDEKLDKTVKEEKNEHLLAALHNKLPLIEHNYRETRIRDSGLKKLCFFKPKITRANQLQRLKELSNERDVAHIESTIDTILSEIKKETNLLPSSLEKMLLTMKYDIENSQASTVMAIN